MHLSNELAVSSISRAADSQCWMQSFQAVVLTPSVVELLDMLPEQMTAFESMAVNHAFDDDGIGKQDSLWNI